MRLTALGGSAAGPNVGAGCSGYLVETAEARIVLDLGPGTVPELRRHADFRALDAVVISHMHLDHILDLATLRFALAYNPVRPSGRTPLWLPPGGMAVLDRLAAVFSDPGDAATFFDAAFDPREYDPHRALEVGDATISFAPTIHYVPTWAMRVNAGGADLGYTADTGPAARLHDLLADVEVVIAEGTLLEPGEESFDRRGHLTAAEAARLATAIGARTLVLTHLWEELGLGRYRDAAAAEFAGRLVVARPGTIVEW
jgi:ribonuclease BN (tRNA processing enzyme)